ncbi:MAG: hypothetical protein EBX40_01375 [Gammaproteobacteria bacterium]|nr:hypothetical protein [Gammaproteobacteria bacterium]
MAGLSSIQGATGTATQTLSNISQYYGQTATQAPAVGLQGLIHSTSPTQCIFPLWVSGGVQHCLFNPPAGFNGRLYDFILLVLFPISLMLSFVAVAIGIILVAVAIYRVREHSIGGRQKSPMATAFYFISGAILIQYGPLLHMISASTFYGFDNFQYYPTVLSYAQVLTTPNLDPNEAIKQFTFSLLLIVGLFSFLRGVFLLIKVGEGGGGPESSLSKAIAHIVAGVAAINAEWFWKLMAYMVAVISTDAGS